MCAYVHAWVCPLNHSVWVSRHVSTHTKMHVHISIDAYSSLNAMHFTTSSSSPLLSLSLSLSGASDLMHLYMTFSFHYWYYTLAIGCAFAFVTVVGVILHLNNSTECPQLDLPLSNVSSNYSRVCFCGYFLQFPTDKHMLFFNGYCSYYVIAMYMLASFTQTGNPVICLWTHEFSQNYCTLESQSEITRCNPDLGM